MPSLPTPGSDNGTWGTKLNEFLQVAHSAGGTIKSEAVTGLSAALAAKASLVTGKVPINQLERKFTTFTGAGTSGNPYKPDTAAFRTYLTTLSGAASGKVLRGDMVWVVPTTATTPAPAPTPTVTEQSVPIGYAMVAGTTTGGAGGTTTTVSSYSALVSALSGNTPKTVYFSGVLTYNGAIPANSANMIDIGNNTTLIGINGATLNGYGLAMWGRSNIIIKNLKINKVRGADCIRMKQLTHHIWIDHCELWADRNNGWDYYDELMEIVDRSNYITVSNCYFHDSHIALLIGSGDAQTTDIGYLKVTIYGCYFLNCSERQPSTRFGFMHVFNNYHKITGGYNNGYAVGVTMGATVRTDNNYFENQNSPILTEYNAGPGYVSGASTNMYVGGRANQISTAPSNWLPPYSYSTYVIPAANVPAYVLANAGVK